MASIRANPDDRDAWLVLADWLTGRGDSRGELILLEHQLLTTTLSASRQRELQQRIEVIQAEEVGDEEDEDEYDPHERERKWLGALEVPLSVELIWRNGFVVGVKSAGDPEGIGFVEALVRHPSSGPLQRLHLTALDVEGAQRLARSEELAGLRALEIRTAALGAEGAAILASARNLSSLATLTLSFGSVGDEGATAIAQSEHLSGLTTLDLVRCEIGDEGARAIARAGSLARLRSLRLYGNQIGDQGAMALSASSTLGRVTFLDLRNNGDLDEETAEALRRSALVRGGQVLTE